MTSGTNKRVRSTHLTIRLTEEERQAIDASAERAGLTAGSWGRQVMLNAPTPRQVRRPPVEKKELVRLLGLAGNATGNLNQLAKAMNSGVIVYEAEIEAALAQMREVRDAILGALGRAP